VPGRPTWPGGLTSKQVRILDDLEEAVDRGERWIVFSERPEALDLLSDEIGSRGIRSRTFHGSSSSSVDERIKDLDDFREDDSIGVLFMSYNTGNTGYNIPQADGVWLYDYAWVPDKMSQAAARILRDSWMTPERVRMGKKPQIRQAVLMGTIDEYMKQLVDLKQSGIDQALDRQEASFDPESWMSYRDFSILMFKQMGLSEEELY